MGASEHPVVGAPQHPLSPLNQPETNSQFAMIPEAVLLDRRLTATEIRVYAVMACARRGPYVNMGERRIAERSRVARRTLRKCLRKLRECGLVDSGHRVGGQRAQYRLTSPLFGAEKQAIGADPGQADASKEGRAVPLVCGKCHQACRGLLKIGICRSCNWKNRVAHIAEGVGRRVAREEIAVSQALREIAS